MPSLRGRCYGGVSAAVRWFWGGEFLKMLSTDHSFNCARSVLVRHPTLHPMSSSTLQRRVDKALESNGQSDPDTQLAWKVRLSFESRSSSQFSMSTISSALPDHVYILFQALAGFFPRNGLEERRALRGQIERRHVETSQRMVSPGFPFAPSVRLALLSMMHPAPSIDLHHRHNHNRNRRHCDLRCGHRPGGRIWTAQT